MIVYQCLIYILMQKLVVRRALTLTLKYNYTPVSNYKVQSKVNPIIAVAFGRNTTPELELQFRLFQNVVPKTAQNFKRLLLGKGSFNGQSLSLIGNHFHHVIARSYAELGHLPTGNCSIYGPKFRDESFELPHDRPGLLSCVSEENTNNSRFLITFSPCPFLDLKNIVFGEVTAESFHNLRALEKIGSNLTTYKLLSSREVQQQEDHHHHH